MHRHVREGHQVDAEGGARSRRFCLRRTSISQPIEELLTDYPNFYRLDYPNGIVQKKHMPLMSPWNEFWSIISCSMQPARLDQYGRQNRFRFSLAPR